MTLEDRIRTMIEELQDEHPDLGSELDVLSDPNFEKTHTLAVTEEGEFFVNEEFVGDFTDEQLKGALVQIALRYNHDTFGREPENANHRAWNIAQDLKINHELVHDLGFELMDAAHQPTEDGFFEVDDGFLDLSLENIHTRTIEEIYEELEGHIPSYEKLEGEMDDFLEDEDALEE